MGIFFSLLTRYFFFAFIESVTSSGLDRKVPFFIEKTRSTSQNHDGRIERDSVTLFSMVTAWTIGTYERTFCLYA